MEKIVFVRCDDDGYRFEVIPCENPFDIMFANPNFCGFMPYEVYKYFTNNY